MAADAHPNTTTTTNTNNNSPRLSRAAAAHDAQDPAVESSAGIAAGSPDVSLPPENTDTLAATAKGKKLAWNRPSTNGAVSESGPAVMGAVSWPALSESTRRASSSDSLKGLVSDGPSGSAISSPSSMLTNSNTGTTLKHAPSRQNSMKQRGGNGSNTFTNGAPGSLSSAPVESANSNAPEPSPRNNVNGDHNPGGSGNNSHHRGYNRRGNNNVNNSPQHGSYQNRRDHQDRGGYDWNQPRGFSNRELRMQPPPSPRAVHRPYMAPPPLPPPGTPFVVPPPVRPVVNAMGYPEFVPPTFYYPAPMMPEPSRGMPFVPPPMPPVVYVPQPDNRAMLVKQIEYYFSPENLCRDIYLRQNMDDQGWVSVDLIANFNRVKQLTNNKAYILDVIQASEVVEVKDEKIRKCKDWMSWVLPPQSPSSQNYDSLSMNLQNSRLEDGTANHSQTTSPSKTEAVLNRSASGNFISQTDSGEANGIWAGSAAGNVDPGKATSAKNLARSSTP